MATETEKEVRIKEFLKKVPQKNYHETLCYFLDECSGLFENICDFTMIEIENGPGKWDLSHFATSQPYKEGFIMNKLRFSVETKKRHENDILIEPVSITPWSSCNKDFYGRLGIAFIVGYRMITCFSDNGSTYQKRESDKKSFVLFNITHPSESLMFYYK